MSNGEGQSEAGNPAVLVGALVVVLSGLSRRQPRHLREGLSEVLLVGAEAMAIEVEVALEVVVGDSAPVVEATEAVLEVATAIAMIEDTVIEVDLAAIGDTVAGSMVVVMVVSEVVSEGEEMTMEAVVSEVDVVAASDTRVGVSAMVHQTVMVLNPVQVGLVLLPLESFLGQGLGVVEAIVET